MRQHVYTITENIGIARDVYKITLAGDTSAITAPGQFVNIKLDGLYLRRPISVCDAEEGKLTLIYKVVGSGTEQMSRMSPGKRLDTLVGLGNGYDITPAGEKPLLIGGGVGVPPLYYLCKKLTAQGKRPDIVMGFNTKEDVFLTEEFSVLGARVLVTTADGSMGMKGFVTDAVEYLEYTYFYACGPEPMLKAVCDKTVTSGQLSFEERMGCGFGACMGCSCETKYGAKRICKDGPVLTKEEIIW